MTTIATPGTYNPKLNKLVMYIAAIGIAAMIVVTHPFDIDIAPNRAGPERPSASVEDARPQPTDWCCLGSKPAEWLGHGVTDVGEVTSSSDKIPRMKPPVVFSSAAGARGTGMDESTLGRDSGGTDLPS